MANRNVGLNIVIAGDPRGAVKATRVVRAEVEGLGAKMQGMAAKAGTFLAGAVLVRWGQQAIQTYRTVGGELLKLQRLTGGDDGFTSGLYVAAQQSGVAVDKLATSVGILSSKLNSKAVEELGIDMRNVAGEARPFDAVLGDIMDRFASMENGAEKNLLARQLFGRSGTDLIPLLNKGSQYLSEMQEKAKNLGIEFNSQDLIEANKNQRDFNLSMTALKVTIGQELLPLVSTFTGFLAQNMPQVVAVVSTLGDAFNGLPVPLKLVAGLVLSIYPAVRVFNALAGAVTTVKAGFTAVGAASDAFRLGLMGVTQQGAGASNAIGGLIAGVGGLGVALPAVAAGIGILAFSFIRMQQESARAEANIADLRSGLESGLSPYENMAGKVARTLSGTADGFEGLKGRAKDLRDFLESVGVDTPTLAEALVGSDEEWSALEQRIGAAIGLTKQRAAAIADGDISVDMMTEQEARYKRAIDNLRKWREEGKNASEGLRIYRQEMAAAGIATDETTGAIIDNTGALGDNRSALERATEAYEKRKAKLDRQIDSARALEDAERNTKDALAELADAQAEAAGRGEAVAEAQEAIVDAREREAEAAGAVVEAQRRLTEAQDDLNEATRTATDRLREKALAAREAADAEAGAQIAVDRARKELERARSGGADALTIREKEQALREAETAALAAKGDAREAAQINAEAQRLGIAGDEQVVEAKQAVEDAGRGVTDAEKALADARVATGEAERRVSQIIKAAKKRVEDATRRVEDAMFDEAAAADEAAGAQGGAAAGAKAHADRLVELSNKLDPNSPLRQRLREYAGELATIRLLELGGPGNEGQAVANGSMSLAAAEAMIGSRSVAVNQTLVLQGTPAQQRRGARDAASSLVDQIARGTG